MRNDARARGWPGVGTGLTSRQGTERREEVDGRGSLTRTALAAAGGCVDNLISGRQARSVRSTPRGSSMHAALIRSASTSVRPPAVGCVCGLSCAPSHPRRAPANQAGCPPPPAGCACAMTARAREWFGDGIGMIPTNGSKDHCHVSR
ncbi:hypothetical protein EVAR_63730_1 [Eumeta japonica]|uniref:Uncharacterized protein n=1 Tax=Eumeta variegata TaxID=151549 RepID=A0A4C1ZJN7_EUMVA|nr:hypothetical protein EVAR_63730_1 [Eumeta japonica]